MLEIDPGLIYLWIPNCNIESGCEILGFNPTQFMGSGRHEIPIRAEADFLWSWFTNRLFFFTIPHEEELSEPPNPEKLPSASGRNGFYSGR